MRISTNQIFDRNIKAINDNQSGLSDLQEQLASQKKLIRPSMDPVGAAQVVRLTEEVDQLAQFKTNNNLLVNALESEDAVLTNIKNSLNRARQLAGGAGSGIVGTQDRKAISVEIEQIRDQIFDLMNTQNASGEYIFAGYQSHSPAFSFNPSAAGNKYSYEGDDGVNKAQISNTVALNSNSSGKEVFEDTLARLKTSITGSTGTSEASAIITEQSAFDEFHNGSYQRVPPAAANSNDFQLTVLAGNQIQVSNVASGATVATLPFTSGDAFTFKGIEFKISGGVGATVDFQLQAPQKKNIAETLNDFVMALNDENINDGEYREALNDVLVGIDNGLETLGNEVSSVGGRLKVAEAVMKSNLDLDIANKSARASIQDLDYAEASAEFKKQETALSAALATFPRVSSLSLFDFI